MLHRGTYVRPCSCEFEALITERMLQGGVRVFSFKTSRNSMLVAKLRVWWFVTKIDRNYLRYVRMGLDKAVDSLDIPRCSVKLGAEKNFCIVFKQWKTVLPRATLLVSSDNRISRAVRHQASNKKACQKRSNDMVPLETEPLARDNKTTLN